METFTQNLEYQTSDYTTFSSLRSGFWVLLVAILGSSMAFIDSTAVNTVLPVLQRELNATITQTQWIIEGYALFISSLILFGGALGDKYGRRRIFIIGVFLFTGSSVWCALAPGIHQLITARLFQGIGGALLVPGSLAIINVSFDNSSRGRAIGIWSAFTAATTGIGPILGGWLAENVSWRWIFVINVPLSIIVLLLLLLRVPDDRVTGYLKLDVAGAVMVSGGLGSMVFGLIESSNMGFSSPFVISTILFGMVLLASFVYYEDRIEQPLLPLGIFRSRTFTGANIVSFLFWAAWNAVIFFIPFCLIQIHGFSATSLALGFLPAILVLFVAAPLTGQLINRIGVRVPLVVGTCIISVSYILFIIPGVESQYFYDWFTPIIFMGLGIGITISPMMSAVMGSVEKRYSGLVSGINNSVGRVAGLVAIAILGIVAIHIFNFELDNHLSGLNLDARTLGFIEHEKIKLAGAKVPEWLSPEMAQTIRHYIDVSFLKSFRIVMSLCAFLTLLSAVFTFYMVDDDKIDTE